MSIQWNDTLSCSLAMVYNTNLFLKSSVKHLNTFYTTEYFANEINESMYYLLYNMQISMCPSGLVSLKSSPIVAICSRPSLI